VGLPRPWLKNERTMITRVKEVIDTSAAEAKERT